MLQSPVIVSATATSGLLVTFTTTTPDVCTVAGLRGSSITLVGPGTCTVRADQAGDGTRAPAVSVLRNFTVSKVVQTITFPSLTGKLITASPVLVSATASSRLPVSFTTTTPTVCTADGGTISLLDAGTCTVRAEQPGDSVYPTGQPGQPELHGVKTGQHDHVPSHRQQDAGGEPGDVEATSASGLPVSFTTTTDGCTVDGLGVGHVGRGRIRAGSAPIKPVTRCTHRTPVEFGASRWRRWPKPSRSRSSGTRTLAASPAHGRRPLASSGLLGDFHDHHPDGVYRRGTEQRSITLLTTGTCTVRAGRPGTASGGPRRP